MGVLIFLSFKQKTAYEIRISDLSSDVCSSNLRSAGLTRGEAFPPGALRDALSQGDISKKYDLSSRHQQSRFLENPSRDHASFLPCPASLAGRLPGRRCAHDEGSGAGRVRSDARSVGKGWVREVKSWWMPVT